MLTDLLLAAAHHLLVFALVAMLVAESMLLRGPMDSATLQRLAKLDGGYGAHPPWQTYRPNGLPRCCRR